MVKTSYQPRSGSRHHLTPNFPGWPHPGVRVRSEKKEKQRVRSGIAGKERKDRKEGRKKERKERERKRKKRKTNLKRRNKTRKNHSPAVPPSGPQAGAGAETGVPEPGLVPVGGQGRAGGISVRCSGLCLLPWGDPQPLLVPGVARTCPQAIHPAHLQRLWGVLRRR